MSPSLWSVIFNAVAQIAPVIIKAIEDAVSEHKESKKEVPKEEKEAA